MEEAGFFPTDRAQVYEVDGGELFLVGTSEVPLSALHRGEILPADALPLRYAGMSTNFRREAGTYGKDTRGIFRVHQFDKVEMFSFPHPDSVVGRARAHPRDRRGDLGGLGLPYRVVNIAAGDLGAAAAKKYDIEAWLPSERRYRELTSCSNYLDYSARRLGTRFRDDRRHHPRAHAQRHRVRDRHARWCSCSSTTRHPTAGSPCPTCCAPTPASKRSSRALKPPRRSLTLGGVPERPNGTVLKTVEAQVSEGSNPSPSAGQRLFLHPAVHFRRHDLPMSLAHQSPAAMRGSIRERGTSGQLAVYVGYRTWAQSRDRYETVTGTRREAERRLTQLMADVDSGRLARAAPEPSRIWRRRGGCAGRFVIAHDVARIPPASGPSHPSRARRRARRPHQAG